MTVPLRESVVGKHGVEQVQRADVIDLHVQQHSSRSNSAARIAR